VGTGPFRIESWNPGSGMIAKANPNWFMGPPKLATIDVRFVSDSNTILANLLSGEVDFINSPGVRGTDAVVAREQWVSKGQGYLKTWAVRMRYLEWQQKPVPNWQQALTDVRVRKGLEYAIDRQGLVDALNQGLGTPADTFILPADPAFGQVSQAVTKYPYDPQRAAASLADAGYRAAQPGSPLLNAQGQPLAIDVWTTAGDNGEKEIAIISDAWKAIGVGGGLFIIPSARQRDNELRQSFPGAETTARSVSADNFIFTADNVPTAANKYAGANRGGFSDPDVERLQHTVLTSFDDAERTRATIALHQRMTDVLGIGPLYYDVEVILAKNKVKGPVGNYGPQQGITWNIYDWSVSE
jgi:peptide/nickel transport system substrate-binding protein